MDYFPRDIVLYIFENLNPYQRKRIARVSKTFNRVKEFLFWEDIRQKSDEDELLLKLNVVRNKKILNIGKYLF